MKTKPIWWIIHSLIFLLLMLLALPCHAQFVDFGRYYALVIGNNDYQHLPKLKMASKDAEAVAKLLEDEYGFQEVILRIDASKRTILDSLEQLSRRLGERDNLLIYYAGHGFLEENTKTRTGFWQPVEAKSNSRIDWIRNDEIKYYISLINAKHIMVVADSCYSGSFTRNSIPKPENRSDQIWIQRMARKQARTALTSGGLEPVLDNGGDNHSVFAEAFLQVLRQNVNANKSKVITGRVLFDSLKDDVIYKAQQTPDYNSIPSLDNDGGDFLFVPKELHNSYLALSESTEDANATFKGVNAELAFWDSIKTSTSPAYFEAFLRQFPNGTFAELAKLKLAELKPKPQAAITPQTFIEPDMAFIQGSCFQMGSPDSEEGRRDNEKQHKVCVDDFYIAKHEVTVAEFRRFVDSADYKTDAEKSDGCYSYTDGIWKQDKKINWRSPGFTQSDDHPAICISWNDATAYGEWLAQETGRSYRLPTEAEWEYAARAKTTTSRYWGDDPDQVCAYANGADLTLKQKFSDRKWEIANCHDDYAFTAPVKSFQANEFELFDMLGNVVEWTCSEYVSEYTGKEKVCESKNNADFSPVLRGGGWYYKPRYLRAAVRFNRFARDAFNDFGFRLARTP